MSIFSLSNGLRVIIEHSASEVVHCGYLLLAGTRHEEAADAGMAHFIEHMSFKGTEQRRSWQVNNALERVGGDLNAFTNKQETTYCATILKRDVPRAIDLLTDIVFHSTYPQAEIDKEVEVIIDEIESYRDSPAELIFDEFEQMLFEGHALGRDILGVAERLREYTTVDARRFVDKYYRPDNAVFYLYGDVNEQRLAQLLCKAHGAVVVASENADFIVVNNDETAIFEHYVPRMMEKEKGTHQAHVMLGAPTFGSRDKRRYALLLLNNVLGGPAMNSRLNTVVRERHGLVYSIDAYLNSYPDVGYWNVYFGCDAEDVKRCLQLVKRELQRLIDTPLTPTQLRNAKSQLCGQIGISTDHRENYSHALAKTFAHTGRRRDVGRLLERIQAVTAEELQELAAQLYDWSRVSMLIYK